MLIALPSRQASKRLWSISEPCSTSLCPIAWQLGTLAMTFSCLKVRSWLSTAESFYNTAVAGAKCLSHAVSTCVAGKHMGIIVGNAQQELLDWLLQQQQSARVVRTDAPMAAGVLEGIARHGLY